MPFPKLPLELRFKVYAYIAIPQTAPLSAYRGLYMSCRQTKAEMDSECVKVFRAHLSALQTELRGVRIEVPDSFPAMHRIHIFLDPIIYSHVAWPPFRALQPLFDLHIISLTLSYRGDNGQQVADWEYRGYLVWLHMGMYSSKSAAIRAREVIFEPPIMNEMQAVYVMALDRMSLDRIPRDGDADRTTWKFHWVVESAGKVKGVWWRGDQCTIEEPDRRALWAALQGRNDWLADEDSE